ncbi:MAG: hypothetical protein R3C44_03020 [Chloroflexota bacterium]
MIKLDGTIQRRFFFPSDSQTTLLYFSELGRIIYFLPHISVVDTLDKDHIRIHYQTVELGAYTINVYCDLGCEAFPEEMSIKVGPFEVDEVIKPEATLNSTSGYGYFSSQALLEDEGDGTGIDFQFRFQAKLPRPRGLRMMPRRVVDRIAMSISQGRMEEMIEGFMESALAAFPEWLESNKVQISEP